MVTAIERLRELLDERGVEYEGDENVTRFFGPDGFEVVMQEDIDGKLDCLTPLYFTPEQAIAATLENGTCHVDVLNTGECAGYECSEYIMHCDGCGHEFGHVLYNENGDVWMSEPPTFCPNCGRRVEVEE